MHLAVIRMFFLVGTCGINFDSILPCKISYYFLIFGICALLNSCSNPIPVWEYFRVGIKFIIYIIFIKSSATYSPSILVFSSSFRPCRSSVCHSESSLSPGVLHSYSIFHYPEFVVFPRVCVLILQPVTYSPVGVTLFGNRVDTVCFFIRRRDRQIPRESFLRAMALRPKRKKQHDLVVFIFCSISNGVLHEKIS